MRKTTTKKRRTTNTKKHRRSSRKNNIKRSRKMKHQRRSHRIHHKPRVRKYARIKGGYKNINCSRLSHSKPSERFYKMKCLISQNKNNEFEKLIDELVSNKLFSNGNLYDAFDNYIDKNINGRIDASTGRKHPPFSKFSKSVVKRIYLRFQEEAVPGSIKYVHLNV